MYIVDTQNNKLLKATPCTFKSLKFEERKNLQEWIAKEPSCLGEDLLIIQKEFDGFSDTKERLDLLAMDKKGNLVIIENKLDDSGKNVTWQAIKYASYCSSLSKEEIVRIYQAYLGTGSAEESIAEFLEVEDIDSAEINVGNSQRIFFVAANFRKEVTSSVLWLLDFGLKMKCFKVTPYKYGDHVYIDFDQIIPIKDAEDYTIKMASKKKEEAQAAENKNEYRKSIVSFWQEFIEYNQKFGGDYAATTGKLTDNWLGKTVNSENINIVVTRTECRTELYINTGDRDRNKMIFDKLYEHKVELESALGPLYWQRLDEKVVTRISIKKDLSFLDEENKEEIFKFFIDYTHKFITEFGKYSKVFKNK